MLLLTLNVIYVLLAVGMIVLILMQRGAGAQAGSGFGGGASATVFGARGSSNFLSKSTKWLAVAFFSISLFMAWYATHRAQPAAASQQDLGVMAQVPASPTPATTAGGVTPAGSVPSLPAQQPSAPASSVPVLPTPPAGATPTTPKPTAPAQPAPGG